MTWSITCTTPLDALMSVATIVALLAMTLPFLVVILMALPCTDLTLVALATSAAKARPATTW